jgi:hypothetical protein
MGETDPDLLKRNPCLMAIGAAEGSMVAACGDDTHLNVLLIGAKACLAVPP